MTALHVPALAGEKTIENRSWTRKYRGRLLIHASLPRDRHADRDPAVLDVLRINDLAYRLSRQTGVLLGAVTLTGIHHASVCAGCCTVWSQPDQQHWQVTDPHVFRDPIPCRGALGLWQPPDDVQTLLAEQMGAAV
jgi:hypothetical protein